jgi:uncharacterized membrane protein YgcG
MRRAGMLLLAVTPLVFGAVACADIRAERQGKQVGDAICDLRSADADDLERALEKLEREMNDIARVVGRPIDEDVEDIEQNITDLIEHSRQGNDVLEEQDIAVIQRNISAIRLQLATEGEAAYDGILEGLAECDY